MKHYLFTGVIILCIGLVASDNPFDLKTNLKKLDNEQHSLISELKQSAGSGKLFLYKQEADTVQPSDQNTFHSQEIKEKPAEASKTREKIIKEKQKQAEQARLKALEEERIAVKKYEAERLRKKQAREASPPKAEPIDLQKVPEEVSEPQEEQNRTFDIEKAMEQAKQEVEQPQTKRAVPTGEKTTQSKLLLDDINLTHEQEEAKERADELYLEAIKDVDAK